MVSFEQLGPDHFLFLQNNWEVDSNEYQQQVFFLREIRKVFTWKLFIQSHDHNTYYRKKKITQTFTTTIPLSGSKGLQWQNGYIYVVKYAHMSNVFMNL